MRRSAAVAVVCLVTGYSLWLALSGRVASIPESWELADAPLYRSVAMRVHGGESYYDVARDELTSRRYSRTSIFNWRTAGYAWTLGLTSDPSWPRAVLLAMSAGAAVLTFRLVAREADVLTAGAAVFFLSGFTAWSMSSDAVYYAEFWSGLAVFLSILCEYFGFALASVLAGCFALFLRELALPYCLASAVMAWRSSRRGEALLWSVGVAVYAVHFAGHMIAVMERQPAGSDGLSWWHWVVLGGWPFLIATARMNIIVAGLPLWCAALYLPFSCFGLLAYPSRRTRRLKVTTGLYIVLFSVSGHPFNYYWGWFFAAGLAVGFPNFIRFMLVSAAGRRAGPDEPPSWTRETPRNVR